MIEEKADRTAPLSEEELEVEETPPRALAISLLALLVAAAGALFRFETLQDYWGIVWILVLIPPFLLSYYRGWRGGVFALAMGMVVLTAVEVGGGEILDREPNWWVYGVASVALIVVSVGLSITTELLRRAEGDPGRIERRRRLGDELEAALEEGQLLLHYQPVISFKNGRIVGAEALVRWEHPEKGIVAPGAFLPTAEETGLIVPLGRWVLDQACRHYHHWQQRFTGGKRFFLSVNLSDVQCRDDPGLPEFAARVVSETGLRPAQLHLEIREDGLETSAPVIRQLQQRGMGIVVDDFGMGHASLNLPDGVEVEGIKFSRFEFGGLEDVERVRRILSSVIELAEELGLTVAAKGIETREQYEMLDEVGCHYGQGFYFARPLDISDSVDEVETFPVG